MANALCAGKALERLGAGSAQNLPLSIQYGLIAAGFQGVVTANEMGRSRVAATSSATTASSAHGRRSLRSARKILPDDHAAGNFAFNAGVFGRFPRVSVSPLAQLPPSRNFFGHAVAYLNDFAVGRASVFVGRHSRCLRSSQKRYGRKPYNITIPPTSFRCSFNGFCPVCLGLDL